MARRLTKQKNVKLFIVDYLQIVPPAYRNQNKVVEVSEISRTLKMAAMETGVPFVTLSQMNRMIDMSDREPSLSDIRESGAIEQDSDSVSFLHQPDREDQTRVNFIVRKNRHGKTGKAELEWTRWNGRFRGVDQSHEQGNKSPI
jgi:replicative DNA helicase